MIWPIRRVYAGIGSRRTPPEIRGIMEQLGAALATRGIVLRTGNAVGADQAFARGANAVAPERVGLYLPWPTSERQAVVSGNWVLGRPTANAFVLTARYHPAWDRLGAGARALQARNAHIVLGQHLDQPIDAVICWTPGGAITGGTGQALRLAAAYNIPVFNLGQPGSLADPAGAAAGCDGWHRLRAIWSR